MDDTVLVLLFMRQFIFEVYTLSLTQFDYFLYIVYSALDDLGRICSMNVNRILFWCVYYIHSSLGYLVLVLVGYYYS